MDIVTKTMIRAGGGDPLEYVMSDATPDRYNDVIDPKGWDLRNFNKNPIALFGHDSSFIVGHWEKIRVEGGKLLGRLVLLGEGVSPRLDEIRAAVKAGVLRAVSVGFRPLEAPQPRENGKGYVYTKSELVECSLVSIPANPNALAVARSLHLTPRARSLIFGESAGAIDERGVSRGEPADPMSTTIRKGRQMSIAEKIKAAEQHFLALKDERADHVNKSEEMGGDDLAHLESLNTQIATAQRTLDALRQVESDVATRSTPAVSGSGSSAARPFAAPARKETKAGDMIIRAASVFAVSQVTGKQPEDILSKMYGNDENTGLVVKAAVAGATTTGSGWAAELVNTAMTDFLETLRPISVYPALAAAGGGRLAFGPNQGAIKIPSRASTPSIGGSFVGEGAPIPVRRLGLTSITLSPRKMGVISVLSREIARYSTPAIEALIRNEIVNDTAITLDSLLLDTSASSAVRPAGLLNGVSALTATAGGGFAAILGDIRKLRAPFDTANGGRNLVLMMSPKQFEALSLTPGPDGTLGWADGIMSRYRVIASNAIAADRLIMVDAADFVTATGDVPEFETSNEALIHMDDSSPAQIGTVGTPNAVAAPVQSMFQTAQIAIRMLLDVSWAMRRPGMVQYIDSATW